MKKRKKNYLVNELYSSRMTHMTHTHKILKNEYTVYNVYTFTFAFAFVINEIIATDTYAYVYYFHQLIIIIIIIIIM